MNSVSGRSPTGKSVLLVDHSDYKFYKNFIQQETSDRINKLLEILQKPFSDEDKPPHLKVFEQLCLNHMILQENKTVMIFKEREP